MTGTSGSHIAKNTFFLYIRTIVSIAINLFTVSLLWNALGVENYGIYNVVGGIVQMFAFLNAAMIASSQRFISFELGRGDMRRLRSTFSMSITVHVHLAAVVLVLAETIGLWFLNNKLNIPANRIFSANVVYQCSILSFLVSIISVPYNACIVAHEHMKVFGYYGILDVVLKFIAVIILTLVSFDRLIVYAVLLLVVSVTMRVIYGIYCTRHFEECRFIRERDPNLMHDMFSFAGWSFIGSMGYSVRDQGINILLNMFFNVTVNAAKGIANQIGGVINGFASNFTMALNPQITKRYAAGDINSMISLVYTGCKYALLLLAVIVIPVVISAKETLHLWLGEVAPYTVGFVRLVLALALIESVISPITTSLQATGRIRTFQIVISIIMILNIPASWIALHIIDYPLVVMYVSCIMSIIGVAVRLILLHSMIPISYRNFITKVLLRALPAIFISGVAAYNLYSHFASDLLGIVAFATLSIFISIATMYLLALDSYERSLVNQQIKRLATLLNNKMLQK